MFPLRDTIPSRGLPVGVLGLIAANALVFLFQLRLQDDQLERLFYLLGIVPARYTHPRWAHEVGFPGNDYWPFLTSIFLHGGWMHIIANMWTLFIFGDNVEDRMGHLRFLAFYLLCGIAAGLVHWFTNKHSIVPTVGASGAIAGVMGAYFLMYPRARVLTVIPILIIPFFIEIPAVVFLGFWFLTQLFSGTMTLTNPDTVGGVAWWAHIGGFIAGAAIYPLFLRETESEDETTAGEDITQ